MKINRFPLPFLFLALSALFVALWAGLLRLGWRWPNIYPGFQMTHGPLMLSGFVGTLITLERAVALKQKWMFAAPLLSGLGWLFTFILPEQPLGPILFTLASLFGIAILFVITRREYAAFTVTMLLGMVNWFAGNLLWLFGYSIYEIVFFWQAFLILTIAGERLELNRVLRISRRQQWLFGLIVALLQAGIILTVIDIRLGVRWTGFWMVALALWSVRNDIAWRNLRHRMPLTRYIAFCLTPGFIWLGVSGILNMIFGAQATGIYYDAILHTVFVGFVLSMIFGHASIIFPALLGVPIIFYPAFYIHLILLHGSLLLRVGGDLTDWWPGRLWGGLLNEVAVILFLGMTVFSLRRSNQGARVNGIKG